MAEPASSPLRAPAVPELGWAGAGRTRLALAVMAASGFAGLGYQIVWTQQSALWLGHEAAAVLAVVTAFFGGLALGALALAGHIERSQRPERWYAGCELLIALWSAVLAALMAPATTALLTLTGPQPTAAWQWAVAFGGTFLLLLPATAAMGATLPAMARLVTALGRTGAPIGALFASNTLGAVLGVLAAAFWLVPQWGLLRTAAFCAALNLACAAAALALHAGPGMAEGSGPASSGAPTDPKHNRWLLAPLALTGLLGIGYEVLVVRVLSQVTEQTVYTFALLLAVYLVGTALGAAAYQRGWAGHEHRPHGGGRDSEGSRQALRDRLLVALALSCLLGSATLWAAELLRDAVAQALGPGMAGALLAEAALATAAFGLPTLVMGALFSHLATQAQAAGAGFARALGVNTLGAAAAPLVFGVWLLPPLGAKFALLAVVAGYLVLAAHRGARASAWWLVAGAAATVALWAPPLVFVSLPEGGQILSYRESATAAVSVVQDADGVSRLRIDNRQQEGSSATQRADARQALLPLLLHPAPRRVLFLGLGTGVTASAAAEDPTLQVDAAELLPEVIEASALFTTAQPLPLHAPAADDRARKGTGPAPRLNVVAADARRFVRATGTRYDLIVSDNFHPARSGSASLYTVEHFKAVQARLGPEGLFCQWLPLHQLDLVTLRSIVQAFLAVYPGATALLATNSLETPVLGLLGRAGPEQHFELQRLRSRLAATALPTHPREHGIVDEWDLLGSFVAGPRALRRFAGAAPLNTDDRPVVAYLAPRITYAPDSRPRDRLLALLDELWLDPPELLSPSESPEAALRLAAYGAARQRFLEAGRDVRATGNLQALLSQVREPLLAVLRLSPEFRPAYDPLLRMAQALDRSDPEAARSLLAELISLVPRRPEAAQALAGMQATGP